MNELVTQESMRRNRRADLSAAVRDAAGQFNEMKDETVYVIAGKVSVELRHDRKG